MANRRKSDPWRVKAPGLPPALVKAFPSFIDPEDKIVRRRSMLAQRADAAAPPPAASVDWRTSGAVSTPRSQDPCNACTSFAIVAAVESLQFIKAHARIQLAPGFIHTCLCNHTCPQGVAVDDALDGVDNSGIAFGFAGDYPFPAAQCNVANRFRVTGRVALAGPNDAMQALATTGPVVGDMLIDPPFMTHAAGAIYKFQDDDNRRLHTVAVIGYDRDQSFWLIANSFGTGWADGGFARVAFGSGGLLADRGGWQILV